MLLPRMSLEYIVNQFSSEGKLDYKNFVNLQIVLLSIVKWKIMYWWIQVRKKFLRHVFLFQMILMHLLGEQ